MHRIHKIPENRGRWSGNGKQAERAGEGRQAPGMVRMVEDLGMDDICMQVAQMLDR